jgi:hypothetical protein
MKIRNGVQSSGRLVSFWTTLHLFGSQRITMSRLVFPPTHVFNSKLFFWAVDSRSKKSFRRVSPSFISVYNLSKLFQLDGPLLLATNTPINLPQDCLTSVFLLLDSSIPLSLAQLDIFVGGLHVKEIDPQFVGNFL